MRIVDSAENRPEGRWIITRKSYKLIDDEGTFVGVYHLCPCCGFDKARGGNYCLNCGAKMKKGARYEMKGDRG